MITPDHRGSGAVEPCDLSPFGIVANEDGPIIPGAVNSPKKLAYALKEFKGQPRTPSIR